jgi:predicted O-methyltransferase YrrM
MAVTRPRHLSRLATFDAREYVADQTNRFRDIGLDYEESIAVAHRIRPNARIHSEHYPLFAGWLATRPASMVLEIGTDTGSFAAFLADLPGGHRVTTVDLPAEDRRYRRATIDDDLRTPRAEVPDERAGNLRRENLHSITCNSMELTYWEYTFDAIWVDGDHTNPVVTIDAINALRLLKPGGLLSFDDVRLPNAWDNRYGGTEAWQVLVALRDAGMIQFSLIYKRMIPNFLAIEEIRKYIAVVRPLRNPRASSTSTS